MAKGKAPPLAVGTCWCGAAKTATKFQETIRTSAGEQVRVYTYKVVCSRDARHG